MRLRQSTVLYTNVAVHRAPTFGAICIFTVLLYALYKSLFTGISGCVGLRDHGRWAHDFPSLSKRKTVGHWQPPGCMLHTYVAQDVETCLSSVSLTFLGDSIARSIFWATAQKLDNAKAVQMRRLESNQADITFHVGQIQLQFFWDPYVNGTLDFTVLPNRLQCQESAIPVKDFHAARPFLVISTGLWHARYLGDRYMNVFEASILNTLKRIDQEKKAESNGLPPVIPRQPNSTIFARNLVDIRSKLEGDVLGTTDTIFLPVPEPDNASLSLERATTVISNRVQSMNAFLELQAGQGSIVLLRTLHAMTQTTTSAFDDSGIHLGPNVAVAVSDVLLNLRCNRLGSFQHYPFDKTCCSPAPPVNLVQIFLLLTALALLAWRLKTLFVKGSRREPAASNYSMLNATAVIALAMCSSYCADRTFAFDKVNKTIHEPKFLFLAIAAFFAAAISAATVKSRVGATEDAMGPFGQTQPFLSRSQTDEWKGWMQMIILLYHYFGMSRVVWIYQIVRLLVSSYLFMTGFGHTCYFLRTNDFSIRRLSAVLFRLNILSVILAYLMRTDYDFYYFPALCSFWFLIVVLTLGVGNKSLPACDYLWVRVPVSSLLTRFILRFPGLLEVICNVLRTLCRMSVDVQEFRFRACLDFYIVYSGIVFGWFYIESCRHDSCSKAARAWKWYQQCATARRIAVAMSATVLVAWCIATHQLPNKFDYNRWHPSTSPIPILAFIILRNATQWLRNHHMEIFVPLGRCSLETFILQYHVWLAGDTKGLLSLGLRGSKLPEWIAFWVEFIPLTTFLLWESWAVSEATTVLTESFVCKPDLVFKQDLQAHNTAKGIWSQTRIFGNVCMRGLVSLDLPSRIVIVLSLLWFGNWIWQN